MSQALQAVETIIFVNYRRTDAGWPADHLATSLKLAFGDRIFLDVRDIDAGSDFNKVLEDKLRQAAILLVLIGEGWLRAQDKWGRRRLDQPDDWVRNEIRTALLRQSCKVIPVLIDGAELPDDRTALPEDIAEILALQHIRIRRGSEHDIEALCREIEKAGFQRITQPSTGEEFSDELVLDVVVRLRQLQHQARQEFVERRALLRELDRLFNRKTFRFEPLRRCPEQRWADRLDSTYQTEKALRTWERNIREVAEDQYPVYVDLLKEVGSYAMQMGVHLFNPAVDVTRIKPHIGRSSFKAQLPPENRFPVGPDKQPIVPDEINDTIERHRERAVRLMNRLQKSEVPNKRA